MRSSEYSAIDSKTGNVSWEGPLSLEKGDHSHMPSRSNAYLPGDERGHVNASSLGGINSRANVVAQHSDLNHGAYYSMEQGERTALQNGATVQSEKTAVVNGQPGERPTAFSVNDSVTYPDGHTESIHHSFANESYATQDAWNHSCAALPGTFDEANPGDSLRDSMTPEAYSEVMAETDASLPSISDDYAPADFSGVPDASEGSSSTSSAEADSGDVGGAADIGSDDGGSSADASPDAD